MSSRNLNFSNNELRIINKSILFFLVNLRDINEVLVIDGEKKISRKRAINLFKKIEATFTGKVKNG